MILRPPASEVFRREAPPDAAGRAPRDPAAELAAGHVEVERWTRGESTRATDEVAAEAPVALSYHGVPHVVMLATPADLEDLAYGFTLSEELVASPEEIRSVEVVAAGDAGSAVEADVAANAAAAALDDDKGSASPESAVEVRVGIAWERFPELLRRRRNLAGRTGCGLCGTETLEAAIRGRSRVGAGPRVSTADLHAAIVQLESLQPLNARTGSVHAAAWVIPGQGIYCVREDVGRHNALDKAIGALVRARVDLDAGYMLVTSRASYEMVQKAATVGIGFLAALSAPTSFAVRHAERSGLTLVAFARRDRHVVYTHGHRIWASRD